MKQGAAKGQGFLGRFTTIRAKILLSFLLLVAVYFVLNLIIHRSDIGVIKRDVIRKQAQVILHLICTQAEQQLDHVEQGVRRIAESESMMSYIKQGAQDSTDLRSEEFDGLSVYKRDHGWVAQTVVRPSQRLQAEFEERAGAMAASIINSNLKRVVFSFHHDLGLDEPVLLAAAAVPDPDNRERNLGVVVGELGVTSIGLWRMLDQLKADLGDTEMYLVNAGGIVVADSRSANVGRSLGERVRFAGGDEAPDWLTTAAESMGEYQVAGAAHFYASAQLDPRLNLRLFVEQPLSIIYAPLRNISLKFFMVALAVLVVAVFLGYHRAVQISKPVMNLARAATEISNGDLEQAVTVKVESNDEIGSLAESFNTMITALRDKMEQIQESQVDLEMAYVQMQKYSEEMEKINRNLQQRVVELSSLNEVAQSMARSLDLDTVLVTIIDVISNVLGFSSCSVKLIDEKTDRLRVVMARGLSEEYKKYAPSRKIGEGITGNVARRGKPAIVLDMDNDPRVGDGNIPRREGFKSMMSYPLKTKDEVIGAINVYSRRPHRFTRDEIRLTEILANQAAISIENAKLFDNIQENYIHTIHALSMAIDAKDEYTRGHSDRVTDISLRIARAMNLPAGIIDALHYASELHDIGKIGISEMLIKKKSRLTDEEMAVIKSHPVVGESIVAPVAFLKDVRPIIRHHHERYDGKGYPDRIKGDEIPLLSRILAVADAYDAMTSDRPYRKALSEAEALNELNRCSGTQFDPDIIRLFMSITSEENHQSESGPPAAKPFKSPDFLKFRPREENGAGR